MALTTLDASAPEHSAQGTFPFGPFSDMETYALSDLDASLDLAEANMAQMLESVG